MQRGGFTKIRSVGRLAYPKEVLVVSYAATSIQIQPNEYLLSPLTSNLATAIVDHVARHKTES
jgi:hypothetical protein